MTGFFINVCLIALASAFLLTLAGKWGFIEYLQLHGNETINKMANCRFCLSWWANVLISCGIAFTTKDYSMLFIPFCSTIITRFVL